MSPAQYKRRPLILYGAHSAAVQQEAIIAQQLTQQMAITVNDSGGRGTKNYSAVVGAIKQGHLVMSYLILGGGGIIMAVCVS